MSLKTKQVKILNRTSPRRYQFNGLDSIEVKTVKGYVSKVLPLAITPRQSWEGDIKGEYSITHLVIGFTVLKNIRLGNARKLIALLEKQTTPEQWESVIEPDRYKTDDIKPRFVNVDEHGVTPLSRIVREAMHDILQG